MAGLSGGKAGRHLPARLSSWVEPVLYSYSQVFFTQHLGVGLLLMAATFVRPALGLMGLGAVIVAILAVRALRLGQELMDRGVYGYNALLVGLAVGAFVHPPLLAWALLPLMVVAALLIQTALHSSLGYYFNLPVLSLPFVLVTSLLLVLLPVLRGFEASTPLAEAQLLGGQIENLPPLLRSWLEALGAIFFCPEVLGGLLVAAALLLYSRIAFLLSGLGFGVAVLLLGHVLALGEPASLLVTYNAMLVAVALGGVWFVPQRSSFVFAALAATVSVFLSTGLLLILAQLGLPALILPFNLTMLLMLYAMRQRTRDGSPKAVDFALGSPEINLNYYRTRVARFGSLGLPHLTLPLSGRWVVTQGVDGRHTHQGLWRHGLDFEVHGADGASFKGRGTDLKDYHCWRLPVSATADGTVVRVVNDVPDNPVGTRNSEDPWGNLVLIQHGLGLYSLVCHLAAGSVEGHDPGFGQGPWNRRQSW